MSKKTMVIKNMVIQNFKGVESLTLDFGGSVTEVKGSNETGKSTLYDAFCYCLNGKNSHGETSFGIKPNFTSEMVSPSVTVECEIDGKPVSFQRVYAAKFAKDKTFKKYQTECNINGLPVTVRDFDKYIVDNIAETEVFKLVTNPKYFTEQITLSKGETVTMRQRNLLYSIVEMKSDLEVVRETPKFQELEDQLARYSDISEYKKFVKTTISKTNAEVNDFPVRINQQSKNFVPVDFTQAEVSQNAKEMQSKKETLENELRLLREQMQSTQFEKQIESKKQELRQLEAEQVALENKKKDEHRKNVEQQTESLRLERDSLIKKQHEEDMAHKEKLTDLNYKIALGKKEIEGLNVIVDSLREKYKTVSTQNKTLSACPTCKRDYPESEVEAFNLKFQYEKLAQLEKLKAEANDKKAKIKEKEVDLEENEKKLHSLKMTNLLPKIQEIEQKIKDAYNSVPIETRNEKYGLKKNELLLEIDELKAQSIGAKGKLDCEIQALKTQISAIEEQERKTHEQQQTLNQNAQCQELINELEAERNEKQRNLDYLQKMLDLADDFIKTKCMLATNAVNAMFKQTKWKLFSFTQDGAIVEICTPVFNGTEYKDLSASTKIICGLDIIAGFQSKYNLSLPIFIDEKETVKESLSIDCQHVTLEAVEQKCEKCGGETGRKQENGFWKCKNCGNEFKKTMSIKKVG